MNYEFEIFGKSECETFTIYIYNRCGNLICKSDDILKYWNGKYKNEFVQEGKYSFVVEGDHYRKTGSVIVIR